MKQRAVIVTGGSGFIGSYLVKQLIHKEYTVVVITRNQSNLGRLPDTPYLHIVRGSLGSIKECYEELLSLGLDYRAFFHLAWNGVSNNKRNDLEQMSNIQFSLETLYLAKKLQCRKWIGTGSQAEYGPLNKKISETDYTRPTTLYGIAKLATGTSSLLLASELNLEVVWVRVFSTYGPLDNSGWLLTDVIRKLLRNEVPELTLGEQLWDYLYVEDAADALIQLLESKASGIYNLGSGESYTIRYVVELIRDMINPQLALGFGTIPYRHDQVMHLEADIQKIKKDTKWKPNIKLEDGLNRMIDYMKQLNWR
ncbi:NAD-dependent epimerase/dehydratase family protein [Paenibacillus hamazuiensis]|uniref:NAD-dependent epimerase/dehydratase family protein n=1 Tax=Paenibacillus hamazuiensis TaxID=2936508 RepID=UPI00200D28D5|nr:NAD(P)-dependent oxidoreductase [Paenibacillus hamazuiensis]